MSCPGADPGKRKGGVCFTRENLGLVYAHISGAVTAMQGSPILELQNCYRQSTSLPMLMTCHCYSQVFITAFKDTTVR